MKRKIHSQFLRINGIAGILYTIEDSVSQRLIIYGRGAPLTPDNGKFDAAAHIMNFETDLFVPDYLGNGRSQGTFSPKNCIKTFLLLHDSFTNGCTGTSTYGDVKIKLRYKEIHYMGGSLGGAYVPLLPRFNKDIKNICAIYPVVDWAKLGTHQPEETVELFLNAMRNDGYHYLYRGIFSPVWKKHFTGEDGLSPIDNISYLKDAYVYIAHGTKDENIYYKNSVNFYNQLCKRFPEKKNKFRLKLFPYDHGDATSNRAVVDYLNWRKIPRR